MNSRNSIDGSSFIVVFSLRQIKNAQPHWTKTHLCLAWQSID